MGITGTPYRIVLSLHVIAVIVGFGAVALLGLVDQQARRSGDAAGAGTSAVLLRAFGLAQWFLYAVPVLGFALLGMSKDVFKASQVWVWLSLLLYLGAVGVLHGMYLPAVKEQRQAATGAAGGATATTVAASTRRASTALAVVDVLAAVAVFLMVFRPGGPNG